MGTGQIILYVFYHTCVTCRMSFPLLSLVLGSQSRVSLVNTDNCFYAEKNIYVRAEKIFNVRVG